MSRVETSPPPRRSRVRNSRSLGVGTVVVPALAALFSLGAVAAEPEGKARAVEDRKPSASATKLAERPAKTVTPPTLTPAALDAMVSAFLESSGAPPASRTTDVEFVRRVYLDVTG